MNVPRWLAMTLALLVWWVAIPLAHGVVPWALSLLTGRHGWTDAGPGIENLLGLIPVAGGIALLAWTFFAGVTQLPERVVIELPPTSLLIRGPYAYIRNPMYEAELGLWFGWAIFFGSAAVLIAFLGLVIAVRAFVVPREERTLEAKFGERYLDYKRTVPKWFPGTRP